jgi:hypothetical protein
MRTTLLGAALVLAFACPILAATNSFILPYDANVTLTPSGGTASAVSDFGLGTSQANATVLFSNLPNHSTVAGANIGFYPAGSSLDVYEKTLWGGTTYWAFSSDTVTSASRTAFMDLDNSLGFGGSVYEKISNTQYMMHLDDAASYTVDDNDHDVLMAITLTPVPEPGSLLALAAGAGLLALRRRRAR